MSYPKVAKDALRTGKLELIEPLSNEELTGIRSFGVPFAKCPKPLTIKDFYFAKKNYPFSLTPESKL